MRRGLSSSHDRVVLTKLCKVDSFKLVKLIVRRGLSSSHDRIVLTKLCKVDSFKLVKLI